MEGEVVPVVDVHLGQQQSIYFEHHILLWKHPNVRLGVKGLRVAAKHFFAGLQIFISEAHGPGNIAFSREAPGQIVVLQLEHNLSNICGMCVLRCHYFFYSTNIRQNKFFISINRFKLFMNCIVSINT
ncbi:AIM24 family protein [Nostoc sp.]